MFDVAPLRKRYSLDDLLRVTAQVPLERRGKTITVYLRTLGVAADDARRAYATRRARLAYRKLQEPDSIERQELLEPLERASLNDLIDLLLLMKRSEFVRDARFEIVPLDEPELPDDPTTVDVVKVEEAQDVVESDLARERAAYVARRSDEYRVACANRDQADLLTEASQLRIDSQVNAVFSDAYADATLFWSVYRDAQYKKPFFASPDEVGEADNVLRELLLSEYYALDVFTQDQDGLKN